MLDAPRKIGKSPLFNDIENPDKNKKPLNPIPGPKGK
jgi:hypothetical protein